MEQWVPENQAKAKIYLQPFPNQQVPWIGTTELEDCVRQEQRIKCGHKAEWQETIEPEIQEDQVALGQESEEQVGGWNYVWAGSQYEGIGVVWVDAQIHALWRLQVLEQLRAQGEDIIAEPQHQPNIPEL